MSSPPSDVSSYSTDGGDVGLTCLMRTPRSSSSLNLADKTFADMGGMSCLSSLNRRGPARRDQMTFGAHAPAMTDMHSVNMQGSGGLGLLLCRTFRTISSNQVTSGKPLI